jgi:hypothetical protein
MNENELNIIAEKNYKKTIDMLYQTKSDQAFLSTRDAINDYCKKHNLNVSGQWHHARGMRDVLALDPDDNRVALELLWAIRDLAYSNACLECGETLDTPDQELFDILYEKITGCEVFVLPNNDFIYLEMPIEHHVVEHDNVSALHRTDGPAILFADGSCSYSVDDVHGLEPWIVETSADKMDPEKILKIKNVDHRRVAIQKAGMHRMTDGAKIIHSEGYRQLYDMCHLFGEKALYLSMVNQSSGQTHIEGVDNNCTTVQDARTWRAKRNAPADLDGDNWCPLYIDGHVQDGGNPVQWQHGDICGQLRNTSDDNLRLIISKMQTLNQNVLLDKNSRHKISGGALYGTDRNQIWVTSKEENITHPEHDTHVVRGANDIWRISEMDHVTNQANDLVD